jgi:hypothetical protein
MPNPQNMLEVVADRGETTMKEDGDLGVRWVGPEGIDLALAPEGPLPPPSNSGRGRGH